MSIFDNVLESIHTNGILEGSISNQMNGLGPRCLNGHVAGCHGFLGVTHSIGDEIFFHNLVDEIGNVEVGWLAGASEEEKATADQYYAECQFLARIIVEQYEDILLAELERHNNGPYMKHQKILKTHWWEIFGGVSSAEEAITFYPHDIIATFNDHADITKDDIIRVVEKARAEI